MPSPAVDRAMELARVDLSPRHRPPNLAAVAIATVASLVLCLLADWLLAKLAVAVFPADKGYVHFQFSDYAKLTIIGVIIACVAWPVVTWISSQPRWLFLRLAVLVTLVLWLPDVWILVHGEPIRGVGVLMLMHLAIALITYPALVHLAPAGPRVDPPARAMIPG